MKTLFHFIRSLWNAARFLVRTGRLTVKHYDKEQRLNVCAKCPHVKKWGVLWQCGVCRCLIQGKAALITEKCPKNLWPI